LRTARNFREQIICRLKAEDQPPREFIEKLHQEALVRHGPFAGMHFPSVSTLPSRLLGTYESEIHPVIETAINRQPDVLVDVGCAEGYYAIGMARRLPQTQVFAFDINVHAQAICRKMALANGVSERVTLEGECNLARLQTLLLTAQRPLIISDCEGYEINLFVPGRMDIFARADVLVELHEYVDPQIPIKICRAFEQTHEVTLVQSIDDFAKPFNDHTPELAALPYGQRYDVLAEKRKMVMHWGWFQSKVKRS